MPTLQDGEPGWCRDEKALYVGDGNENHRISGDDRQIAAQAALATDANLAAVVTAFNALLAAMKASGIMKSE